MWEIFVTFCTVVLGIVGFLVSCIFLATMLCIGPIYCIYIGLDEEEEEE